MKNKKGFTLIELIAIIAILGIMVVIVLPQMGNSIESRKQTQYDNLITTVKSAAKVYYSNNQSATMVSVATLISENYVSSGMKNPISGNSINGCITITQDLDGYNVYTYYEDCNDI